MPSGPVCPGGRHVARVASISVSVDKGAIRLELTCLWPGGFLGFKQTFVFWGLFCALAPSVLPPGRWEPQTLFRNRRAGRGASERKSSRGSAVPGAVPPRACVQA